MSKCLLLYAQLQNLKGLPCGVSISLIAKNFNERESHEQTLHKSYDYTKIL